MLLSEKLFRRHLTSDIPFETAYRIELLNKIILTTVAFLFFGVLYRFITQEYLFSAITLFTLGLLLAAYFCNSPKNHSKSLHAVVITCNVFLFISTWLATFNSGVFLLYFTILTGYSLLLDLSKRRQFLFYLSLTLVLFLVNLLNVFYGFLPQVKGYNLGAQRIIFLIVAFLCVAVFTWLMLHERYVFYRRSMQQLQALQKNKQELGKALEDKDVLLAEVYHRVKNNLSVISSMLSLQLVGITDEYTRSVLTDSKNRISSMAMIHQHFYQQKDYGRLDLKYYIESLIRELLNVYQNNEVNVISDVSIKEKILLSLNTAIPVGIILNEVLTNCLKHAFKGRMTGTLVVSVEQNDDVITIIVRDDGHGFDYENRKPEPKSLGLILIEALVDQIEGRFSFLNHHGTVFTMAFKDEITE